MMSDAVLMEAEPQTLEVQTHPLLRRIAHWLLAVAVIIMVGSGWRIYNDVPIFWSYRFPIWITLGGQPDPSYAQHNESGTGSAIAWHFAGMWLLLLAFCLYLLHGLLTRHLWRDLLPVTPRAFWCDFSAAARFQLVHRLGEYNAVQKVFYWGVLFSVLMMFLSGLAIWKPVQFAGLTWMFGGFDLARVVHFMFMSAIVGFLIVHVTLVILVPKTFVAMTLGRATARPHGDCR